MDLDRLLAQFESLGDSCEFGLVQRHAGAEPLGLLRFAGFMGALDQRLETLVAALDRGFEGLGNPDTVQVTAEGVPEHQEYIIRESAYGLTYHTFLSPTDVSAADLRKNESTRLRFLRRKLVADLAKPEKIFVWKSNLPIALPRIHTLLAALRRRGPATLLWVCEADATTGRVGSVERLADGLLRGVIDQFAPYATTAGIKLESWYEICANAARISGASTGPDDADRTISLASLRDLTARAAIDPTVGGVRGVSILAPAGDYTRAKPVVQDTDGLEPSQRAAYDFYHADQVQPFDDVLKVVFERALVTGQGAVITQDGYLVRESCWEFLEADLVPYGLTKIADQRFRLSATPSRTVHDPVLLLKRPWWRNYRHWLVDAAALLALAATRLDASKMQLLIGKEDDPALNAAMRELLSVLAPRARILEHPDDEVWRLSDLHYITPVHIPPLFKLPAALSALRTRAHAGIASDAADRPRRRIYVSPRAAERPQLDNEAEIIALCAGFGFEVVVPELCSMTERIALFRDAEAVIGVKTPHLANIVFCQPSAVVIALSPGDWPDPFYADIAGQNGLRYGEIFGPVIEARRGATPNDFRIEPNRLEQALAALLDGGRPAASGAAKATQAPPPPIAFEKFLPIVSYPDHQGEVYLVTLSKLHRALQPRTYLEVGTQYGEALVLAECPSVAIDPWAMLDKKEFAAKPGLALFQMSSDAFFANHAPAEYLGGPVELAFLDGPKLHFEIVLRDFINVERCAMAQSVVMIHDAVPPDVYMASRDRLDDFRRSRSSHPMWWTGDVWKVVDVLRKYRPDLVIDVFDASPTGLVMVRGLDPASRVLAERYDAIVNEVAAWRSEELAFADYRVALHIRSTSEMAAVLAAPIRARPPHALVG
jgi:capsular polysaccharide biosynthesis protein